MSMRLGDLGQRALRLLVGVLADDESAIVRTAPAMSEADWKRFVDLAVDRHQVAPAVVARLSQFDPPDAVAEALKVAAQNSGLRTLGQMAALRDIREALDRRSVEFVVLKGWILGTKLFGSPGARVARDIDILIHPDQILTVAEELRVLGYISDADHPEQHRMLGTEALAQEFNNVGFKHPDTDQMVELHWRSHQFRGWPELFATDAHLEAYDSAIGTVKIPNDQANLIYLAIHGSMHRWARLKWLMDIAALVEKRTCTQLQQDLERAREIGAARPVELALCLSAHLLGAPCPKVRFSISDWLPRQCLHEVIRPEAVPTGLAHRLKFYAMLLALAEDTGQRVGVLRYRLWGKNRLAMANMRNAA